MEPRRPRDLRGVGPLDHEPLLLEPRGEALELVDGVDAKRGMCLCRRPEVARHAHVELVRARSEPRPSARLEQRGLHELLETEQLTVEPSRLVLAAGRRSDLDVVEADDHVVRRNGNETLGASRDPGPEKRTRFSRWVPCRSSAKPLTGRGLPSCDCWFTLRARGHA